MHSRFHAPLPLTTPIEMDSVFCEKITHFLILFDNAHLYFIIIFFFI